MPFRSNLHTSQLILTLILLASHGWATQLSAQTTAMVEFFAAGRLQKGLPLVELTHEMVVIGRDGWIHSIDPRKSDSQLRSLSESYAPASVHELRSDLQLEFGRDFEVLSTQNFLIVQPIGRGDQWPRLFEQSHRAFVGYMSKRGVPIRQGRFPMIAIVFPDEISMYREFEKLEIEVQRVAGLYSGNSNRVMTHDAGHSAQTEATVRHEAAHQSAFNSGVHSRVNDTPRWILEGVGQMFEPSAMTDPRSTSRQTDRVNGDSMQFLRRSYDKNKDAELSETIMQLVSDDSLFEDPKRIDHAYAVSWAMMFYLAEREQVAFAEILRHTAARPPFQPYSRTRRLNDVERITGVDLWEFSKRISRFVQAL